MAVTEPRTIRTARIDFLDVPIKLVHIPLKSYAFYVQPLLQILFPLASASSSNGSSNGSSDNGWHHDDGPMSWMNKHALLSLTLSPNECSLFCAADLAEQHFASASPRPNKPADAASVSPESYIAISVEGEGLDAGQRVLELTTPLAMAGISIFFITTYFSDYILVPTRARGKVVKALEARGFVFDLHTQQHGEHETGLHQHHRRMTSSMRDLPVPGIPCTPGGPAPPTVSELQARTVALLKKYAIAPAVRRDIRLVHCAGRADPASETDVQLGLVRCLAHPPRFLSVTLTATEPASLLMEAGSAPLFFSGGDGSLARAQGDVLVPVVLDLGKISLESSGIVCGLASKLAGSVAEGGYFAGGLGARGIDMTYLSTVRGAAVLVAEEAVDAAVEALKEGGKEGGMEIA